MGTSKRGRRGNGEGTITRRVDGRWEAKMSLADGRRKAFYGKTRAEVAAKLNAALRDRAQGVPVARDARQTVAQWLATWLELVKPKIKAQTYRRYEQVVRVHLAPPDALGRIRLAHLTPQDVQALYAAKLQEPRPGGGRNLSPLTVRRIHSVLHAALASAVRFDLVARNVTELVEVPRAPQQDLSVLTLEQAHTLLDAAAGDRLEALYVLALTTGARQGELLALTWDDLDLDQEPATLHIRATLEALPYQQPRRVAPKTAAGRRVLRLPPVAVRALRAHRMRQLEERLAAGPHWRGGGGGEARGTGASEAPEYVFCNEIGEPLDGVSVTRTRFYGLLARAGLPHIRFHDLRHTAATLLFLAQVHPKATSGQLGHSTIGITMDTYTHDSEAARGQIADVMEHLLGDGSRRQASGDQGSKHIGSGKPPTG